MSTDPAAIAREIARRAVLEGRNEPGTEGRSENRHVSVSIAGNGDLTGVSIDPRVARGVDVARLEVDIIQAWRRAQRSLFTAKQDEMAQAGGVAPPDSFYEAVQERFRDPPIPAETRTTARPRPPSPPDDDYFDQPRLRA